MLTATWSRAAAVVAGLGAATTATFVWVLPDDGAPMPETTFAAGDADTYDGPTSLTPGPLDGARVVAPSVDLEVPLVASGMTDGLLEVPVAPQAGWYAQSAPPGSEHGATVIAGHVDQPDGELTAFSELAGIEKGAPVFVVDEEGRTHAYRVTALELHGQDELPAELFTRAGDPVLHLVTCAGDETGEAGAWNYEFNLVVTAELVAETA